MITQKQLKTLLHYNPNTGQFRALVTRGNKPKPCIAGQIITGHKDGGGYLRIWIYGRQYSAHRLAWLYMYGSLPQMLDHKNGNRSDNRIDNLRQATRTQNCINARRYKNNTTGFKGVTKLNNGSFRAQTMHNKKGIHLGLFDSAQAAHAAYVAAVKELHGEFANEG
jgi:hypothetical protein